MYMGIVSTDDDDHRPEYPVTQAWRDLVEARLKELDISQAELARRIGRSGAAITNILHDNKSSKQVPDIHAALGWPRPPLPEDVVPTKKNRDVIALTAIARELPEEILASTLAQLKAIAESRKKR